MSLGWTILGSRTRTTSLVATRLLVEPTRSVLCTTKALASLSAASAGSDGRLLLSIDVDGCIDLC